MFSICKKIEMNFHWLGLILLFVCHSLSDMSALDHCGKGFQIGKLFRLHNELFLELWTNDTMDKNYLVFDFKHHTLNQDLIGLEQLFADVDYKCKIKFL